MEKIHVKCKHHYIDISNQKFGLLTVVKRVKIKDKFRWECLCECGKTTYAEASRLRYKRKQSCGCLATKKATKHGLYNENGKERVLYKRWITMKARCYNPKNKDFHRYGAKGISVCDEWKHDFLTFYNWSINNGFDKSLTIDRIDGAKGYYPENCRYATVRQQNNNTKSNVTIEYNGDKDTISMMASKYNIRYGLLVYRIKAGWNLIDAFTKPSNRKSCA